MDTEINLSPEPEKKLPENKFNLKQILEKAPLRLITQVFIVAIMFYAAWNFYGFYQYVQGNIGSSNPYRPPVVEGFLPIAALVAFKAMLATWTIDPIHPAGLVIFIAILLTAWIFRRALCSWICPIGTLSEYLGKLGKKTMGDNIKIPRWLDIILLTLKYGLFIYIFRLFILLPAQQAISFMQIPYYTISDIKMFEFFLKLSMEGIAFIGLFMMLSFLFKSFFCRYVCPYGALLGIFGIFSPIVLKKNDDNCIKCDRCNKVCPNRVNVMDKKIAVISTECTGCTSCVTACPKENTLEFKLFGVIPMKPLSFSLGFIAVFFGIIILAILTGHWDSTANLTDYQNIYQMMPPGGF